LLESFIQRKADGGHDSAEDARGKFKFHRYVHQLDMHVIDITLNSFSLFRAASTKSQATYVVDCLGVLDAPFSQRS
jgi:hypothetical protein